MHYGKCIFKKNLFLLGSGDSLIYDGGLAYDEDVLKHCYQCRTSARQVLDRVHPFFTDSCIIIHKQCEYVK